MSFKEFFSKFKSYFDGYEQYYTFGIFFSNDKFHWYTADKYPLAEPPKYISLRWPITENFDITHSVYYTQHNIWEEEGKQHE